MTAYQGGKKKIGKKIAQIMLDYEYQNGFNNLDYFEPFCGMCGVLTHMINDDRKIVANDLNTDLILMWQAIQQGWIPDEKQLTKDEYNTLKNEQHNSKERAFYTIAYSFNNEYMGPYRNIINSLNQNYLLNAINGIKNIKVDNIVFTNKSYIDFTPKNMLIYCDPPYQNNNFHYNTFFQHFNHNEFWDIMRTWSKDNIVFISEYTAPNDFECVWEKKCNQTLNFLNKKTNETLNVPNNKIERLFIYKFK